MKQQPGFLTVSMVLLIALAVTLPVAAQAKDDEWEYTVAPYLVLASMSGEMAIHGIDVDVDVSTSDLLSNLQMGFNGYFAARKGDWGFGVDVVWMSLGASTDYVNVDPSQAAFMLIAIRRLAPTLDLHFGVRWNVVRGRFEFKDNAPPALAGLVVEDTKQWVDPIVGLHWKQPLSERWMISLPVNVGGFGISSKIAFDAFPTLQFKVGKNAWIGGGWRFLYMDYETGYEDDLPIPGEDPFRYDVLTHGPVVGMAFRF